MKNKKKINPLQGQRLEKALKDARLSQKSLAALTGYTAQHINNVIKGKRSITLESARTFSKVIFDNSNGTVDVSESYLLGETDSENFFNTVISNSQIVSSRRATLETLLTLLGYERTKTFWKNFDSLSPEDKEKYKKLKGTIHGDAIPLLAGSNLVHEFYTPNNSPMYIDDFEYEDFLSELLEYIVFKFNYALNTNDSNIHTLDTSRNNPDAMVYTSTASTSVRYNKTIQDMDIYEKELLNED